MSRTNQERTTATGLNDSSGIAAAESAKTHPVALSEGKPSKVAEIAHLARRTTFKYNSERAYKKVKIIPFKFSGL
jgi:hypothetical protein